MFSTVSSDMKCISNLVSSCLVAPERFNRKSKCKVVPVSCAYLNTTPWRHTGKWRYNSTQS